MPTPEPPTIVGKIEVHSTDGYTSLAFRPTDGYARSVTLYCWSDGIVTWMVERSGT